MMTATTAAYHQQTLLHDTIAPLLAQQHPRRNYAAGGHNCTIAWNPAGRQTALQPAWFYVPNIAPRGEHSPQRSYTLWNEKIAPRIVVDLLYDGQVATDPTSTPGERLVLCEQMLRAVWYIIFDMDTNSLTVNHRTTGRYESTPCNEHGHYALPDMGVQVGLWHGSYADVTRLWLRWWDATGELLLTPDERLQLEQIRLEHERERNAKLAALLRTLSRKEENEP